MAAGHLLSSAGFAASEAVDDRHDNSHDTLGDALALLSMWLEPHVVEIERTLMIALMTLAIAFTTAMMQLPMAPKHLEICNWC